MSRSLAGLVLENKYRLTRQLGRGGMGVVWAAEHVRLGRGLAVKLLRADLAEHRKTLQRFHQEAIAASRIGSPHIVEVIDLGTTPDGAPFIVMELLEGRTLFALLRETPQLPVPRAADILTQVLSGLAAAHAKGIVHRDLKPANIFLTRFGNREDFVKIVDFGVSKILSSEAAMELTRTGALLGTPTYMAPEQVLGRADVDHRVDLWATGVCLYLALTGRRPHETMQRNELLTAIVRQDIGPFRHLRPEVDANLERIVLTALSRDMGRRWATAEAFREALLPYRAAMPSAFATAGVATPAFSFAAVRDVVARASPVPSPVPLAAAAPAAGEVFGSSIPAAAEAVPAGAAPAQGVLATPAPASAAAADPVPVRVRPRSRPADAESEPARFSVVYQIEPIRRDAGSVERPAVPAAEREPSPSRAPYWIAALAVITIGAAAATWIVLHLGADDRPATAQGVDGGPSVPGDVPEAGADRVLPPEAAAPRAAGEVLLGLVGLEGDELGARPARDPQSRAVGVDRQTGGLVDVGDRHLA